MTAEMASLSRGSVSSASAASTSGDMAEAHNRSYSPDPSEAERNKVMGACSSCRRSKVKCEHDGSAPCKRCRNGGYECIFKPREMGSAFLHDEWRVKTDETLTKLVSAINALVQQESSGLSRKRKAADDAWQHESNHASPAIALPHLARSAYEAPGSAPSRTFHEGLSRMPAADTGYRIPNGAFASVSAVAADLRGLSSRRPSGVMGASALSSSMGHDFRNVNGSLGPGLESVMQLRQSALPSQPSLPLPRFATSSVAARVGPPLGSALPLRPSRYRYPDLCLGSNDPRLDAIRLGLLTAHEARSLFSLYAKRIEPYAFGFPDFPASSELTPVLLSAITSVASRHALHSDLRERQLRLRSDVLDRTLPYAPATAEDEFNPESGIGTEEVVGACIWSAYDASLDAWRVARAARWWSEKYSYESGPHAGLTVGEMVAILPPVRPVNMQDRVRVWLAAFLAELHQCEIHERDPIMQLVDPAQYAQALVCDLPHGSGSALSASPVTTMTKQDAALVFYCRTAFLTTKSRDCVDPDELLKVSREITGSYYSTRALLASDPDRKDEYDHTVDLHHALAKARMLMMAYKAYAKRAEGIPLGSDDVATASRISCAQHCHSAGMDVLRLLLAGKAGFIGNLAVLPLIYHHWICGCLAFLLKLAEPDDQFYRLGLFAEGQLDDTLRTLSTFIHQYINEVAQCSTSIPADEQSGVQAPEPVHHPALEPALLIADLLAGVRATA